MNDINTKELFRKAKNGDIEARDYLIENNMRLVHSIAKSYLGTDYYDSMVQEGNIGLIKAVDNFEPERGFKFSTYAYWKIKGEMRRFIRDSREDIPFRVKREDFNLYGEIQDTKTILINKLNREPTLLEIAKYIDVTVQQISEAINAIENYTSLQSMKCRNEEGKEDILMSDAISDYESSIEDDVINKVIIDKALNKLTEKQRKVIHLRYYKNLSQAKTGQVLNISQAQISRIEKRALELMREAI